MQKAQSSFQKGECLYEGKAKRVYQVKDRPEFVIHEFKNSLTAFNGLKKSEFIDKGAINRDISVIIFKYLNLKNINQHYIQNLGENSFVTKKVKIFPLEVVVRNIVAGSLAKKFNLKEGDKLKAPLLELYYKNDSLNDPFISDEHVFMLDLATPEQLIEIKKLALKVNEALINLFLKASIELVDFKIECGLDNENRLLVADEISPDTCRLWDQKTGEKLDKDRFRRDMGGIEGAYQEVLQRLTKVWSQEYESNS